MLSNARTEESVDPHTGIKHKFVAALDILAISAFLLIVAMLLTGGWEVNLFNVRITVHRPENAGIAMLIFLVMRKLTDGRTPIRDIPLIRNVIRLLEAVTPFVARKPRITLAVLITGYVAVMGTTVIMKHNAFQSNAYDLGIFSQLLWSAANGHGFHSSVLGRHFLGEHFSPILYIFVPGYSIWPHPTYLLMVQTVALALAAIPIYMLASRVLKSVNWGLFFSILYLCYQPMRNVNLFDFHSIALATPFLMLAFYFLHERKNLFFLISLGAALACKEEVAEIVFIFGVYIFLVQKRRLYGTILAASGIAVFFLLLYVVIPYFREESYFFVQRYDYLGGDLSSILETLVTRPLYVARHVFTMAKLEYIWHIFGPLGFLSLLSPQHLLLTIPTLVQNLLSSSAPQYSVNFQYTSPLTPFVFVSAIFGSRWLFSQRAEMSSVAPLLLGFRSALPAILIVLSVVMFGKSPTRRIGQYWPDRYSRYIEENVLSKIPADASVSGQDPFVPHLTTRTQLYEFPVVNKAEYVILDSRRNKWPADDDEYFRLVGQLMQAPYRILLSNGSVLFLERCSETDCHNDGVPEEFLSMREPVLDEPIPNQSVAGY